MNVKFKSINQCLMKFPHIKSDRPPKLVKLKRSLASVGLHLEANMVKKEKKPTEKRK